MLGLLVPALISFLLEGAALKSANKHSLVLHENSLQWLMKIGKKYPQVNIPKKKAITVKSLCVYLLFVGIQKVHVGFFRTASKTRECG